MGDSLNPPNETNPKGQFEDREVNQINEPLLASAFRARHRNPAADWILGGQPGNDQRWEARLNRSTGEVELERRHQEPCEHLCTLSGYAGEVA